MMKQAESYLGNIPLLTCGEDSDRAFLFVHGQCGNKEEAVRFAKIAGKYGYQTVSLDLPEHNNRTDGARLVPWEVLPELDAVNRYMRGRYSSVSLRANSIGAYFSLTAFAGERFEKCLLVSPLLDMVDMISGMMRSAGVCEAELMQKGEIPTGTGQVLSWRYLMWAREHPVKALCTTDILYSAHDELIGRQVIDSFVENNPCRLQVIDSGHWVHTPEEVRKMEEWENKSVANK